MDLNSRHNIKCTSKQFCERNCRRPYVGSVNMPMTLLFRRSCHIVHQRHLEIIELPHLTSGLKTLQTFENKSHINRNQHLIREIDLMQYTILHSQSDVSVAFRRCGNNRKYFSQRVVFWRKQPVNHIRGHRQTFYLDAKIHKGILDRVRDSGNGARNTTFSNTLHP